MKITIYSTPTCPYCNLAKDFLREHKIQFREKDVSMDKTAAAEMIDKSKQMGVPVIDIDGQIVVGYDREKLKKLLKL